MTAPGQARDGVGRDDELIERYLRGELTGVELDAFEVRLLDEPELLARSEGLSQFHDALRRHGVDAPPKPAVWAGLVDAWRDLVSKPGHALAFASCAAVVATASWLVLAPRAQRAEAALATVQGERDALRARVSTFGALAVAETITIPRPRGDGVLPATPVPPADAPLIAIDVPLPHPGAFDVELRDEHGSRIAFREGVRGKPDSLRALLVFPREGLSPGRYKLVVANATTREQHVLVLGSP